MHPIVRTLFPKPKLSAWDAANKSPRATMRQNTRIAPMPNITASSQFQSVLAHDGILLRSQ